MKRLFALLLIPVLCLCAACKKNQPAPATPGIPGAVQTVGSITVFVPEGWEAVPDDETQIRLCKGDAFSATYIKLRLHPNAQAVLPPQSNCENVQSLEERAYGSQNWCGFSGTRTVGTGIGTVVYLATQNEGSNYLATLWYDEGSTPISLEDADVQAILSSLTIPVVQEEEIPAAPTDENVNEGPVEESGSAAAGNEESIDNTENTESSNELAPDEGHS